MPRSKGSFRPASISLEAAESQIAELSKGRLAAPSVRSVDVPVERIRPNPFQARQNFEGLDELAGAIREHGFTSRLLVRHDPVEPRFFQLVYGERRLRAAQLAGLADVPCDVGEYTDQQLLEIGLLENIQRQDLNPLEEAQAFQRFIAEHGYTQQRLADRISKDINYVNRRLKLLETPLDVQAMVVRRPDTISVARDIARLPTEEERRPLIEQVISGAITSREIQARVRSATMSDAADDAPVPQSAEPDAEERAREWASVPPAPSVAGINVSLDRDMRAVQRIFAGWIQQVGRLDEARYNQLVDFMNQHLVDVQRLMDQLEQRD